MLALDRVDLALTDFIKVIEFCEFYPELLYRLFELHIPAGETLSFVLGTSESPLQIYAFALKTVVFAL